MAKVQTLLLPLLLLFLFGIRTALAAPGHSTPMPNFYAVDVLSDGETERRFFVDGIAAKETSAVLEMGGIREGAVLRQMSNGRRHIQLIYDADLNLQDCEYISDNETAERFVLQMAAEYRDLASSSWNSTKTVTLIGSKTELPDNLVALTNYRQLKAECRHLHNRIRKQSNRVKRDILMLPATNWCGVGNKAKSYGDLGAEQKVDFCCRRHDHCPEVIRSQMTKYEVTNKRPITLSHCDCDERRKRGLDDIVMVPNTKWCGRGNRATLGVTHLGAYQSADRCCRQHDACEHYILAYEDKYGLYNSRPYSAMHCTCDDRFRSCLKQANTAASNLIGKLFFNIIQTKCFVLKPEKVCKKNSWWGKCTQHHWTKKAHLRDPIPY